MREETIAFVQKIIGESDYLMLEPGEFRPSLGEQRELLERYARSDGHLYLIAEVDGEIVGILHFQPGKRNRNAHAGEFGMSVRKKFWGMSIGRLLLQFLLQWAANRQDSKDQSASSGGQRPGDPVVPIPRLSSGGNHNPGVLHRWQILRRPLDGHPAGLNRGMNRRFGVQDTP